MNCLFCKRPEAFYVELHLWDASEQRARMLLPQGVCIAHRESAVPRFDTTRGGLFYEIFPELRRAMIDKLVALHQTRFPDGAADYTSGMTFFPYDSLEGGMARAARGGHVDTKKAGEHAPKIEIEKVALEDFDEAVASEVKT